MTAVTAYIGLGANLGDARATLAAAIHALSRIDQSALVAYSRLFTSKAIGPEQPDYLNAVAALQTQLKPADLLKALQDIEHGHGRVRDIRWGPRTLDLDILLFGDAVISTSSLIVPHMELKNRNFALIPLLDIAPDLAAPGLGHLHSLPAANDWSGLQIASDTTDWAHSH